MPITTFNKAELLLPMTGANNGTVFTDYSLRQRVVTRTNAVTSTAQSRYSAYGSSGYFDGNGDFLSVVNTGWASPVGHSIYLRTGFRCQKASTTNPQVLATTRPAAGNGWWFIYLAADATRKVNFAITNSSGSVVVTAVGTTTININQWYDLDVFFDGTDATVLLDKSPEATATLTGALTQDNNPLIIGRDPTQTARDWEGHIQDFLFMTGITESEIPTAGRMAKRTLTRTNTGIDSHEYDRAILFDWNGSQNSVGHTGGGFVVPDSEGDFVASDLLDLEYGVALIKDGCTPVCRGPVSVDADA
jgi:hypothetical protein